MKKITNSYAVFYLATTSRYHKTCLLPETRNVFNREEADFAVADDSLNRSQIDTGMEQVIRYSSLKKAKQAARDQSIRYYVI